MSIRAYLTPVGLLVLPVLAANLIFAKSLPAAYQPAVFWDDIPSVIALPENASRIAMFALMVFLPFKTHRLGFVLYSFGVLVYAAAWSLQVFAPDSALALSPIGFTAPAWTAGIWLVGIGMLAQPPEFSPRRVWVVVYWLMVASFLLAHIAHAGLVWSRL